MISTRILSGANMLRGSAALLLVGGPLLGLLFGSLGMAALVFGFGAVLLGLGQLRKSENRGGRWIGFTFVLAGAFTVIDAAMISAVAAGFMPGITAILALKFGFVYLPFTYSSLF